MSKRSDIVAWENQQQKAVDIEQASIAILHIFNRAMKAIEDESGQTLYVNLKKQFDVKEEVSAVLSALDTYRAERIKLLEAELGTLRSLIRYGGQP